MPEISPEDKGGSADEAWIHMANRGIRALNELSGCVNSSKNSKKKSTRAQRRCTSNIASAFKEAFSERNDIDTTSALSDLCGSSHIYGEGASVVEPYAKERVSWPQVDSQPVGLLDCLPAADSEWLQAWQEHMLIQSPLDSPSDEVVHPYIDPVLKHNRREYTGFLKELANRNMIKFKQVDSYGSQLGIFFVKKKSGQLRLIFDTRKLNQQFVQPPHTDLPTADAFSRITIPEGSTFYVGSGDLANAFYTLAVPDTLGRMFTLPAIQASSIGVDCIDGVAIAPGTQVTPYLTVLPMGWSWALHLCQMVMDGAISQAGFNSTSIISDKGTSVNIGLGKISCGAAGYVDNFAVIGCNRSEVDSRLAAIGQHLRGLGLTVHEEEAASTQCDFVGLRFNGITGHVSIKPSRIVRLQAALQQLLNLQVCNSKTMQQILGHITWALMCRREGLAILSSAYAFAHSVGDKPQKIWPSVRWELGIIRDLLPLFRARINIGWSPQITASDSSPWGFGVCVRNIDDAKLHEIGQCSERWRYRVESAIKARSHALSSDLGGEVHSDRPGNKSESDAGGDFPEVQDEVDQINSRSCIPDDISSEIHFSPVDASILHSTDWTVVWSAPWKFRANILGTEARALVWSVEHLLRANRNIGKHIICLVDNLPVALAATKGRGKSSLLKSPLRHIASLLLATGSRLHVRWIPSELNIADKPSRARQQWEAQGLSRWWESTLKDFPFSNGSSVKRGWIKGKEVVPAQHQEDVKEQWQQGSSGENIDTGTKVKQNAHSIFHHQDRGLTSPQFGSLRLLHTGLTYLESRSVKRPTILDYQMRIDRFVVWCQRHQLDWVSSTELDAVVTLYLQALFDSSKGQDEGIRIIAALKFFIPEVSRLGEHGLPRAARALKGWNLARPQQQRLPMPLEVLGAIMGVLMFRNFHQLALRLFIQFSTYMRPGECSNLQVSQLIPPQSSLTGACQFWAVLLHPHELMVPGKTALFDGSILLDSDVWLSRILHPLVRGRKKKDPLWTESHHVLKNEFMAAVQSLRLEDLGLSLYAIRHGGASHDLLAARRPLLEVKKRGRWATDASLRRYVKEARLQHELSKVNPKTLQFGMQIIRDLPQLLTGAKPVINPPLGISK